MVFFCPRNLMGLLLFLLTAFKLAKDLYLDKMSLFFSIFFLQCYLNILVFGFTFIFPVDFMYLIVDLYLYTQEHHVKVSYIDIVIYSFFQYAVHLIFLVM